MKENKNVRKDAPPKLNPLDPEEAKKIEEQRQRIVEMIMRKRGSLPVPPKPDSESEQPPVWDNKNHYWTRISTAGDQGGPLETWDPTSKRWVDKKRYDDGKKHAS